jgi:hypothetical protein
MHFFASYCLSTAARTGIEHVFIFNCNTLVFNKLAIP